MEALQHGVRLYREPGADHESGVWLSAGSELVRDLRVGEIPYLPSAVVPSGGWRVPDQVEQQLLFCRRDEVVMGSTVLIVRMSDTLVQLLRAAVSDTTATIEGAPLRSAEAAHAAAAALDQLRGFIASDDGLAIQGIRTQIGGLRTTTTHRFAERVGFIGLHVDRWHDGPYGCRDHAQLAINLGVRDRFLVFLNLPVDGLTGDHGDETGGWLTIPRDFALRRGGYPLVRVRISPGEAYIAPTENLVHDVSLEGSDITDICFLLRGRFRLPA